MLFISIFAFYYVYYRKSISDSLIITLATIYSIVLLFSTIVPHFNLHVFALIAIALLSKFTFDGYKKINIKFDSNLEKKSFIYFIILISTVLYFGIAREQLIWDEYSHWAYSIKYLTSYGRIPYAHGDVPGHGGIWYPWGLAIYSFSVSYPFNNYSLTSPVIINCLLLIATFFLININKKILWSSFIYFMGLILLLTGDAIFIGYADFAQSLVVAISALYVIKISEKIKIENEKLRFADLIGFSSSLILLVSLKESGKYILCILFITWGLCFFRGAYQSRNLFKICGSYLIACIFIFLWMYKLSFISEKNSRDIGIATLQNLDNLKPFFSSAYEQIVSSPRIFLIPLILLCIFYVIKNQKKYNRSSNLKFVIIFSVIYLIFIITAFIVSFGTIEFVKANSFARYIELISVLFSIFIFKSIFENEYFIEYNKIIFKLILVLFAIIILNKYYYHRHIWEKNDIYLKEVASLLYNKLNSSGVYYVDYATYGLHPIMINFYYKNSKNLSYLPVSIYKDDRIPDDIMRDKNIGFIVIIDETSRIKCYEKSSSAYTISFKNPNNLSYVLIPKEHYYESIDPSCRAK